MEGPLKMIGLNRHILLFRHSRLRQFVLLAVLAVMTVGLVSKTDARPLTVRVDRWLEVRNVSGTVDIWQNNQWRQAQSGQRLSSVGHGMRTGAGSLARLAVDTQVGFIGLSENTAIAITRMETTASGGKITNLEISRGQARVFVRPFTNPESQLEIRTPAGVNGVRGTEFGVAIQPSGRSSLVVEEGRVDSSAQGQSVPVNEGFQNFTVPGEPPSEPMPITEEPNLNIQRLERQRRAGEVTVLLEGSTFVVNALVIEGTTQEIIVDEDNTQIGRFAVELPLPADRRIEVTVTTPLGKTQIYDVVVP